MAVATAAARRSDVAAVRTAGAARTGVRRRWLYSSLTAGLDGLAVAVFGLAGGRAPGIAAVAAAGAAVGFFALHGHYRTRLSPSVVPYAGELVLVSAAVPVAQAFLAPSGSASWSTHVIIITALVTAAALAAGRVVSNQLLLLLRRRGVGIETALIVGAGQVGVELAGLLRTHPRYGLRVIGFVDDLTSDERLPLPFLGSTASLAEVLEAHSVTRVLIAFGAAREPSMIPLIRDCDRASVDIHVVPRFFELGQGGRDIDLIWGVPLRRLRRGTTRPLGWRAKRAFDIVMSTVLLLVLSPLLAAIAVALKVSDRGPVLFRQRRVGRRGRPIVVYKFRSVRVNQDSDTRWTVGNGEGVTVIGRFLRRTSLDELPQLVNVLRGDMSIVGPRPERPHFVRRFSDEIPRYQDRHRVPVGLTGWAQVHGLRGDTSIVQRARFDNGYIENWSLWLDVVIVLRTTVEVIRSALGHPRR